MRPNAFVACCQHSMHRLFNSMRDMPSQPDKYLPRIHFEEKFCMACFWDGQDPETSYITHFLKVSPEAVSKHAQYSLTVLCLALAI